MDLRFFFNVSFKVSNQNYDDEKKTPGLLYPLSLNHKQKTCLCQRIIRGYTYNDHVRDSVLCEPVVFVCYKQANS